MNVLLDLSENKTFKNEPYFWKVKFFLGKSVVKKGWNNLPHSKLKKWEKVLEIQNEVAFSIFIKEVLKWIWKNENLGQVLGTILGGVEHWNRVARKSMKS